MDVKEQKSRKINERFDFHLTFAAHEKIQEISRADVEKQYSKLGKGDCDEMVARNLNPRGEMKVRTQKQTEGKKFLSGNSGKIHSKKKLASLAVCEVPVGI